LNQYRQAEASFRQAIRLKPDYGLAYYNLGITYLDLKDKNKALEQYRVLQRIDQARAQKLYAEIHK